MSTTLAAHLIDDPSFRPLYVPDDQDPCLRVVVENASCAKCLGKIEAAVSRLPAVTSARLDLGQRLLTVRGRPGVQFAPVLTTLKDIGYAAEPIPVHAGNQAIQVRQDRRAALELGIAGAAAGNIMLLAIAQYAGADESIFDIGFGWLALALFLPVLAFSARGFYVNFLTGLKAHRLSIDTPVVASLTVGTTYSVVNLVNGSGETYFDSLSALIFLLLAARTWQRHIQRKLSRSLNHIAFLDIKSVRRWHATREEFSLIPPEALQEGDRIALEPGERLPADSRLVSGTAEIDQAVWTGESVPQRFSSGQLVPAGARLVSGRAEFKVEMVGSRSRLGQLLERLEGTRSSRSHFQSLVDKVGEYFTIAVLLTAAIYVILYWRIDPIAALHRALALTLLACPCALAIATPLALSRGLELAQRSGLIIKNAETLERLGGIHRVLFDKTGTLTKGQPQVVRVLPENISTRDAGAIWALEKDSVHPFGQALTRYFSAQRASVEATARTEVAGQGVRGEYLGHDYRIARATPPSTERDETLSWIGLWRDGDLIAHIGLIDPVREDAGQTIARLSGRNIKCEMATGDQAAAARTVAKEIGLANEAVHAALSPEEKLALISNSGTMVVGDGVNDTLAMARADVAVAVRGGAEASLKTADVYLATDRLVVLDELFAIAHTTRRTILRNLAFSLTYNLTGATLALLGYVHPLLAAVLMPVSSATLVVSTLWGQRPRADQ